MLLPENQTLDYKSIRKLDTDKGIKDLAISCVSFANAQGGNLYVGFEDKTRQPLPNQKISEEQHNEAIKRLKSNCYNVSMESSGVQTDADGNQYFIIKVLPSLKSFASTADGRFYIRIADQCVPMRSEDFQRIAFDKETFQWELVRTQFKASEVTTEALASFCQSIRSSKRVSSHILQMSDEEIISYYNLVDENYLTNLGVLWLGNAQQRSRILYPITVQYIVYNELEQKVRKVDWHDNLLNPKDLLLDIERQAIELTYSYEIPNGLFRKQIRHYHPHIVRELLLNAFAHKSFTISGDIMIQVYPDRMEISNPGSLPLGVTKDNILHQRVRRNPHFIRIMHDLELMEGEGSGYDLIYELDAIDVKQMPIVESDFNNVTVTQYSAILSEDLLRLIDFVTTNFQGKLKQKNLIALGLIARNEKMYSTDLTKALQLTDNDKLRHYVSTLTSLGIIQTRGVKKGMQYLVNPQVIRNARLNLQTTLKTIEPYRLQALIEADLTNHPQSSISEIASRLPDVDRKDIQRLIYKMVEDKQLVVQGARTNRRYSISS
jgi:ATP-dependent DNA helicase RecG